MSIAPLMLKLFSAAYMQRWNDKLRSVDLNELDKQAHKMIIACFLGKFEESNPEFDWLTIIEGGLFELLQRVVVTDLKPPVYYRIREDPGKYQRLNEWVYGQLEPVLIAFDPRFAERFKEYSTDGDNSDINRKLLSAAHFSATSWEFAILERTNPHGYEIREIRRRIDERQEQYYDLRGMQQLALYTRHRNFVDLCGELRFQTSSTGCQGHRFLVIWYMWPCVPTFYRCR